MGHIKGLLKTQVGVWWLRKIPGRSGSSRTNCVLFIASGEVQVLRGAQSLGVNTSLSSYKTLSETQETTVKTAGGDRHKFYSGEILMIKKEFLVQELQLIEENFNLMQIAISTDCIQSLRAGWSFWKLCHIEVFEKSAYLNIIILFLYAFNGLLLSVNINRVKNICL